MDPAQVPPGGLPWVYAIIAIGALAAGFLGILKWAAAKVEKAEALANARVDMANASKEKMRLEKDAQIAALENEIQDELRKALDQAYAHLRSGPPRPADPPPGISRKKKTARELIAELGSVTGQFRREDLAGDTTQDV